MTERRYLTVPQLAKRMQVEVGTVYAWNKRKRGPHYTKVGRGCRYLVADVEKWEKAHFVESEQI